jgi:hypothetical protein
VHCTAAEGSEHQVAEIDPLTYAGSGASFDNGQGTSISWEVAPLNRAVVLLQMHREYLNGSMDGVRLFNTRGVLSGPSVERL